MAPIPKRTEALARPRSRKGAAAGSKAVTQGQMRPVTPLEANPAWNECAIKIFEGAASSGQSSYYQDSDYAVLYTICEVLSRTLNSGRMSGQVLATVFGAIDSLGLTEGDRRKMRIELQPIASHVDDASVTAIADYKAALGVTK